MIRVTPEKPVYADSREWKRGLMMIACFTCVPVALVALAKVMIG